MKMGNQKKLKQNGLSLVELLITLVVISIISTIAIPNLSKPINKNNLLAVRDSLVRDLNHAKNSASRMGVSIQIVFNKIVTGCGNETMAWALIRVSTNEILRCQPKSSNLFYKTTMTFSKPITEWTYLPNGLSNSKEDMKITFTRESNDEIVNIFAGGFINYEN
ncbi:MAG: prepilin-type N-terminal cleavage/methylation domain-containing protein [Pseudomonadota bacterium]